PSLAVVLVEANEVASRRALRENLVANAPQERLVGELGRLQVRREDQQHDERNLDGLARLERQEIDPALERPDPSVQQIPRRAALPPEIVDHQNAAVCRHLPRRAVELADRVVAQLERLQRQLAADRYDRAPAMGPAAAGR